MRNEDLAIFFISLAGIWVMLEFLTLLAYANPFRLTHVTLPISAGASAQITLLWINQHKPEETEELSLKRDLRILKKTILKPGYSRPSPSTLRVIQ